MLRPHHPTTTRPVALTRPSPPHSGTLKEPIIYRFGPKSEFNLIENLASPLTSQNPKPIRAFVHNGTEWLVFCNGKTTDPSTTDYGNCPVYYRVPGSASDTDSGYELHQVLRAWHPYSISYYNLGGTPHIAIGSYNNGGTVNVPQHTYRWDGTFFKKETQLLQAYNSASQYPYGVYTVHHWGLNGELYAWYGNYNAGTSVSSDRWGHRGPQPPLNASAFRVRPQYIYECIRLP